MATKKKKKKKGKSSSEPHPLLHFLPHFLPCFSPRESYSLKNGPGLRDGHGEEGKRGLTHHAASCPSLAQPVPLEHLPRNSLVDDADILEA